MKGRVRNFESVIFFISQNEIFFLCRMFDLQYDIGTLHWKRADGHYAFSYEPHRKEHSPNHHLCSVFLCGGIQKPYSCRHIIYLGTKPILFFLIH